MNSCDICRCVHVITFHQLENASAGSESSSCARADYAVKKELPFRQIAVVAGAEKAFDFPFVQAEKQSDGVEVTATLEYGSRIAAAPKLKPLLYKDGIARSPSCEAVVGAAIARKLIEV